MNTEGISHFFKLSYAYLEEIIRKIPSLSVLGGICAWIFVLIVLLIQVVSFGWIAPIPTDEELAHISNPLASEVYTVDGVLMGKYYLENRRDIEYRDLPEHLIDALIATEDIRFYDHDGVDRQSLIRVFVKTLLLSKNAGGGSTITQQLVKNLFPRQEFAILSLPINKIREAEIAQRLEELYSKDEIIRLYLNTVSFGENAFGIEVASNRFFNRKVHELNPEQAAVLVGMLKAPTTFNPYRHPETSLHRRNIVLRQMEKYDLLPSVKADSLVRLPLETDYRYQSHNEGLAPYFREHLRQELVEWCKRKFKPDGTNYNLYTDGLKVYTTIHADLQKIAETSALEHMKKLQHSFDRHWKWLNKEKATGTLIDHAIRRSPRYQHLKSRGFSDQEADSIFQIPVPMKVFSWEEEAQPEMSPRDSVIYHEFLLHCGFLAMEPQSGHIRAWVGGINHNFFQYDHVTSRRQTGSVFKPMVYAAALEAGEPPCGFISNDKTVFKAYNNWTPKNSDNTYGGEYSMQGALANSVNVVAVNLIMKIGVDKVVELSRKLGIHSELPEVPSLALGTADVSLEEITGAYSAFVNGGFQVRPTYILRIEDQQGNIVMDNSGGQPQQVLSERTASMLTYMLESVVNEGTARSLRTRYGLRNDIAGKTGTSQSQADGWFIAATPDLVAGAWVGAEDQRVHFQSLAQGQGAATALPIVANFLKTTYEHKDFNWMKKTPFTFPADSIMAELDCDDFWFPLSMSEFSEWWQEQKEKQEAEKNAGQ